MKYLFIFIFIIAQPKPLYGQEDTIKKIIYEDLYLLNNIYNGCIIQYEQSELKIFGKDTILYFNTIESIKTDFLNRVKVLRIDSLNNYFYIEVRFDLLPQSPFLGLFTNNTFNYVLYRKGNKFLKINGFTVSEILFTDTYSMDLRGMARIDAPKKFGKFIINRNSDKIKNYLSISVLQKINALGIKINFKPYVIEHIGY
jgi:hypothetical protein